MEIIHIYLVVIGIFFKSYTTFIWIVGYNEPNAQRKNINRYTITLVYYGISFLLGFAGMMVIYINDAFEKNMGSLLMSLMCCFVMICLERYFYKKTINTSSNYYVIY